MRWARWRSGEGHVAVAGCVVGDQRSSTWGPLYYSHNWNFLFLIKTFFKSLFCTQIQQSILALILQPSLRISFSPKIFQAKKDFIDNKKSKKFQIQKRLEILSSNKELTGSWQDHSWKRGNLASKTCRVSELPRQRKKRWRPNPAGSKECCSIQQCWKTEGRGEWLHLE